MITCWKCGATATTSAAIAWHVRLIHQPARQCRQEFAKHAVDSVARNQGLLKLFADGDSDTIQCP